jgi:flagellar hook-length control protein FliK
MAPGTAAAGSGTGGSDTRQFSDALAAARHGSPQGGDASRDVKQHAGAAGGAGARAPASGRRTDARTASATRSGQNTTLQAAGASETQDTQAAPGAAAAAADTAEAEAEAEAAALADTGACRADGSTDGTDDAAAATGPLAGANPGGAAQTAGARGTVPAGRTRGQRAQNSSAPQSMTCDALALLLAAAAPASAPAAGTTAACTAPSGASAGAGGSAGDAVGAVAAGSTGSAGAGAVSELAAATLAASDARAASGDEATAAADATATDGTVVGDASAGTQTRTTLNTSSTVGANGAALASLWTDAAAAGASAGGGASAKGASAESSVPQSGAAPALSPLLAQSLSAAGTAAAAVTGKVSVPVSDPGWPRALAAQVQWMVSAQVQSATLRLSPEHLGPLEVRIELQSSQINVSFSASHAETRSALADAVPQLRELFAAGGLNLGQATVQQEAGSDTAGNSGAASLRRMGALAHSETVEAVAVTASRTLGLVDEYV